MRSRMRGVFLSLLSLGLLGILAVTPVAAGPAEISGTLTVAYFTLFDETLNPLLAPAAPKAYYDVMYEYLVYPDPDTWKLLPGLATRWQTSPDGRSWVFFLRKGVTFSDGTELTAEDVKFSLELLTRKEARWPLRATFLLLQPRVVDRHTIAFDSKTERGVADVDGAFAQFLGLPIVSKAHYEKVGDRGYDERPIGTGPYVFKARRAGDFISFEARPDWKTHWRVGEHWGKYGAFTEIVFKKVPEVATRVAMLRTGQADIIELTADLVKEVQQAGFTVVKSPESYIPTITFHGVWLRDRPAYDPTLPWVKREVRQALSLAINRKEIAEKFYFGTASPIGGQHWFVPGLLGWNPNWKPDPYDRARAQKLLADAGYPKGFTIPLRLFTLPGTSELPALGEVVAGYWEKVGVKAELIRTEWAVHRPDLVKRTFKGATVYRGFPNVDTAGVFRLGYHSKFDFGEMEDPFIDSAIDDLISTVEPKARVELAQKLGDFLTTNAATLNLVSASYLYGVSKRVKTWQPTRGKYPDRYEFAIPTR